jgi:hypothetical protein
MAAPQAAPLASVLDSIVSTGHFRRTREQSSPVLIAAPQAAPLASVLDSIVSTGPPRRTREQSSPVLVA